MPTTTGPRRSLDRYRLGTFADIVYRNSLIYSAKEAFVCGAERVTFAQFNAGSNRLVHALHGLGLAKAETLGVVSWNCMEMVYAYGAAMKGGFIVSPYNARLQEDELTAVVNDSAATVLIVGIGCEPMVERIRPRLEHVRHLISCDPSREDMIPHAALVAAHSDSEPDVDLVEDDPFLIIYTSGTTGVPKGALYTHGRKLEDAKLWALNLVAEPKDRAMLVQPLFHIAGTIILAFMYVGATHIIMANRSFDPVATVRTLEDEKVTFLQIVPTLLVPILDATESTRPDLSALTRILYAASPMPVDLLRRGLETLGLIFVQSYGQSESGPNITSFPRDEHDVLNGSPEQQEVLRSAGRPCVGVQVRIVDGEGRECDQGDVGEITVRSKSLMVGYWRKPEETARAIVDGWLHTGDMGFLDADGYLYLVDRKMDMIVTGGENVYPYEVEQVLCLHPAVKEAAVVGLPDSYWVERVHAFVVLEEPHGRGTTGMPEAVGGPGEPSGVGAADWRPRLAEELRLFGRERLAGYKVPKSVEFIDALPRTATGKVLRRELRERNSQIIG
jgi:long-chain acyl-CoA synthetase